MYIIPATLAVSILALTIAVVAIMPALTLAP